LRQLQENGQAVDVSSFITVSFVMKSDIDPQEMEYYLELIDWTADGLDFKIHFTDPLLTSSG
jgi:hypothetical protein